MREEGGNKHMSGRGSIMSTGKRSLLPTSYHLFPLDLVDNEMMVRSRI